MIGSDILYQPDHAMLVSQFIDRHSRADVEVLIGDPGRAVRSRFTRNMTGLGYLHGFERFDLQLPGKERCKGRISQYLRCAQ